MTKEYSYRKKKAADAIAAAAAEMGNRPPQAPEVEEAVIGAMMVEGECVYGAMESLSERSFYDPKLRLVFGAVKSLFNSRSAIDIATVAEKLREDGVLDEVGGAARLAALTAGIGSAAMTGTAPATRRSFTASCPNTPCPMTMAGSPNSRRHLRIAADGNVEMCAKAAS